MVGQTVNSVGAQKEGDHYVLSLVRRHENMVWNYGLRYGKSTECKKGISEIPSTEPMKL